MKSKEKQTSQKINEIVLYCCARGGCQAKFEKLSDLKLHLEEHDKEYPIPCERCYCRFKTIKSLNEHLLKHKLYDEDLKRRREAYLAKKKKHLQKSQKMKTKQKKTKSSTKRKTKKKTIDIDPIKIRKLLEEQIYIKPYSQSSEINNEKSESSSSSRSLSRSEHYL